MGLFNKKKTNGPRLAVADQPSLFMCDDSEGNHGKEAMLDYQLSYLLRIANTSEEGSELGKRTLMKLLGKEIQLDEYGYVENIDIDSVKVWKQWQHIDLIVEVNAYFGPLLDRQKEQHVIVIENKAYTGLHDDQLNRYAQDVEEWYKDKNVQIQYWVISFFNSDNEKFESIDIQCKESNGDWKCLSFEEVVDLTDDERQNGTGNEILDEFWVKKWY